MDGTVTMQDSIVTCKSCNHFGESCASTNPDSQVGDCNEYEPMKSYVSPDICRSCANINETCVPENDNCCSGYKPLSNKMPDDEKEFLLRRVIEANLMTGDDSDTAKPDMVNHPNHYTQGGIECIKAIEASMPPDGFQDYCKGNVMKYVWRFRQKNGLEDLKKARVYLNWMIESVEKETANV